MKPLVCVFTWLLASITLSACTSITHAGQVIAVGQEKTSWRVGDTVGYRIGCVRDAALDLARAFEVSPARVKEVFDHYSRVRREDAPERRSCFMLPAAAPAQLTAWIDGPFRSSSNNSTVSVWKVQDAFGDTEFIIMADEGGRHPYAQEQAL